MKKNNIIIIFILIISLFFSCKKKNNEEILIEQDIPSLKEVYKDSFLIGTAVAADQLDSPKHVQLLKKHFSSITAENEMKPESIQPAENKFTFEKADKIVRFAKENKIKLRGHTLIWHNQVPGWFFKYGGKPASKELLQKRMKKHITSLVKRYKGKIYAWDVVNEPVDANEPDGLRRNQWFNILGEDYIELAFKYAKKSDPKAKLFLNEYDTTDPKKLKALINLTKKLIEKKVPVDGIGMQMHISLSNPSIKNFENTLKELSQLGIEIHITEMDLTVYSSSNESFTEPDPVLLNEQGHHMKDLFAVTKKYENSIQNITFWGMADDHTWLKYYFVKREDWPLPFDNELKAKPFYWGMVDPGKLSKRTKTVKAIDRKIKIDGIEEDQWILAENFPNLKKTGDLKADIKASWDSKNLYILLKVTDNTPLNNDKVILFVDEKNNKSETPDDNDYTIELTLNDSYKNTKNTAVKKTKTGYILETCIPLKTIEADNTSAIGFDVSIKDDENNIIWNYEEPSLSNNPKNWGIIKLTEAPKGAISFYGTPEIDGTKDAKYNKAKPLITDLFIQGIEGEDVKIKGATMKSWTLWDEKALYVYSIVKDPVLSDKNKQTYMQDSVEVFLDENNNKTTTYQDDDGQYRVSFKNTQSFGRTGGVEGFKSAAKIIPGGYAVEMKIPFRSMTASKGTIIGFDLQVNDDHGTGRRDSISKWNDNTNNSWQSTSGFGLLIFKK